MIDKDASALRQGSINYDFISSVAFEPGNEEDTGVSPLKEEFKVTVAPIHSDDAASRKCEMAGSGNVGSLTVCDHGEVRQIAVMVQEQVELNSSFGLTKVGPGKQAQTKVDGGGVEAKQPVLETKLPLFAWAIAATEVAQMKEGVLVKPPGAMGIGIGKCASGGSGTQPQMGELAAGDGQSIADFPQAFGLGQLTEEHGYILAPGGEALGVAFRPAFVDQPQKQVTGHYMDDLTEQTCGKLHGRDSFEVFGGL